jgi:hypothetical protein
MSDALFQSMNVHGVKKITVGKTEGDYRASLWLARYLRDLGINAKGRDNGK